MKFLFWAALSSGLLMSAAAEATTVRAQSLYEKTETATDIVRARVLEKSSTWTEGEKSAIRTIVRMQIIDVMKGEMKPGETFDVLQAGGQIGDFVHHVPGMSPWKAGEEAVLFVVPYKNTYVEIGIGVGKYGISDAGAGLMVTHDPKVALAYIEPGQPMRIEDAQPMKPELLTKFVTRVRDYVHGRVKPRFEKDNPPHLRPKLIDNPIRPSIEK